MTTTTKVEIDGRMSFYGGASDSEMEATCSYHNAEANTMFTEHLGRECAVAIRRWYLENNCLHPEDSAPMSCDWSGFPCWDDFSDQTGGQGDDVDQLARGEFAQRMICRVLADAIKRHPALVNLLEEFSDLDGADQIDSLLEMALWKPAKEGSND